jgi:hypothetical protein
MTRQSVLLNGARLAQAIGAPVALAPIGNGTGALSAPMCLPNRRRLAQPANSGALP